MPSRQYCSSPLLQFAHSPNELAHAPHTDPTPTRYLVTSEPTSATLPAIS
jgi:hypothetical protein